MGQLFGKPETQTSFVTTKPIRLCFYADKSVYLTEWKEDRLAVPSENYAELKVDEGLDLEYCIFIDPDVIGFHLVNIPHDLPLSQCLNYREVIDGEFRNRNVFFAQSPYVQHYLDKKNKVFNFEDLKCHCTINMEYFFPDSKKSDVIV